MTQTSDLDTLGIFKELKSAGMDDDKAEALARTIKRSISEAAAGKTALEIVETRLESRIVEAVADMRVKAADTRSEFYKLEDMVGKGEHRIINMAVIACGLIMTLIIALSKIAFGEI